MSFQLGNLYLFTVKIYTYVYMWHTLWVTYQTAVNVTVLEILMQWTQTMHAAGLMWLAPGPGAGIDHQFHVAGRAWDGDPQLS